MNENIASEIEARNAFENKYGLVGSLLASGNYSSWAQRLKRVFNIDIETCSGCGGAMKVIACIEDPIVIKQILDHLKHKAETSGTRALPESRAPPAELLLGLFD